MTKKFLQSIILSCLLLSNSVITFASQTASDKQSSAITYKEIGDQLISSLGIVETEVEEQKTEDKFEFFKKLPASLTEIAQLSEGEKLKLLFELLEKKGASDDISALDVSSYEGMRVLAKELELFFRNDAEHAKEHLFSQINNTQTVFGQSQLSKMLTQPIDDVDVLRARQAFIQELVQNESLFAQVEAALAPLAQKESDFLSFWKDLDGTSKEAIKFLQIPYFTKLNKNTAALATWNVTKKALSLAPIIFMGCQAFLSTNLLLKGKKIVNTENPDLETKKGLCLNLLEASMRMMSSIRLGFLSSENKKMLQAQKDSFEHPHFGAGAVEGSYQQLFSQWSNPKTQKGLTVASAFNGVMTGFSLATTAFTIKREQQILRYMQTRLTGAAELIKSARALQAVVDENPYVASGLFMKQHGIEDLEERMACSKDFAKLVGNLETATFAGNYSFFSMGSRIAATFELMQQCKDKFAGLMQFVGELDACLSVAKLYKKMQANQNASYCFVEYVEQNTPYIKLEEFWNPMIDPKNVVTNNIEMNASNGARNVLLTGSNTGGKSTILKGVVINILFSRLGIAPARRAVMTPFTYLATSLNISDNTAQGISLFNAEVLRAKNIAESIKSLKPGQHGFVAIDELFVGTASDKGAKAAYKFADHISTFDNTICLLATHFKTVTQLEEKTNGIYKNYKIDIIKNADGTLTRPFKIEEGMSDSNVANEILQENMGEIDFL